MNKIKYFALIPTKSNQLKDITKDLLSYLAKTGVDVILLPNKKSIFSAYEQGLKLIEDKNPQPNDVIILCHDDIEILNKPEHFRDQLNFLANNPNFGFVGPAGTTFLGDNATWWDHQVWHEGHHSGFVMHGTKFNQHTTYYGEYRQVVVLDGLFLAARYQTLKSIKIERPSTFEGMWDFYDLYYTMQAHKLGLNNNTLPFFIRHESMGDLAGRDSWHKNREAFKKMYELPEKI
jgi:hypothetical protein